jgi:RNA polymerase sigma-70 factor (ECF subfamily)
MSELTTGIYLTLAQRLGNADAAVHTAAMNEIFEKGYNRLQRLVAKILNESFPNSKHDVDSVVSSLYIRLRKAFDSPDVRPKNATEFFQFAAYKVRQVLLDTIDSDKRQARAAQMPEANPGDSLNGSPYDPGTSSIDPAKRAKWMDLHEQIDKLPEDLKDVFSMRYYLDFKNAEIATELGLHPKEVSRRWLAATGLLAPYLPRD